MAMTQHRKCPDEKLRDFLPVWQHGPLLTIQLLTPDENGSSHLWSRKMGSVVAWFIIMAAAGIPVVYMLFGILAAGISRLSLIAIERWIYVGVDSSLIMDWVFHGCWHLFHGLTVAFVSWLVLVSWSKYYHDSPAELRYQVNKGLLCHHSGYFTEVLGDGTQEGATTQWLKLHGDDLTVFEAVYSWLYTRQLCEPTTDEVEYGMSLLDICKIYVYADEKRMPALKNDAIDELINARARLWTTPLDEVISYTYDNTDENAGIRKLIVHMFVSTTDLIDSMTNQGDGEEVLSMRGLIHALNQIDNPSATNHGRGGWSVPKQFLVDVLDYVNGHRHDPAKLTAEEWRETDPCLFHNHSDGNQSWLDETY